MSVKGSLFVIVAVIVALSAVGAIGYFVGFAHDKAKLDHALKLSEAHAAEAAGYKAAVEVEKIEIARLHREHSQLHAQSERLIQTLEDIGSRDPIIREVTRWKTEEIEVPVEKIIGVPGDCSIITELPFDQVKFDIEGSDARIETRRGNRFAVGEVRLFRVSPPPRELIGGAPWETDITELVVVSEEKPLRLLRHRIYAGRIFTGEKGWTLKYSFAFTRRVGVFGGAMTRDTFSADGHGSTLEGEAGLFIAF